MCAAATARTHSIGRAHQLQTAFVMLLPLQFATFRIRGSGDDCDVLIPAGSAPEVDGGRQQSQMTLKDNSTIKCINA
jgi:hypothetical protein